MAVDVREALECLVDDVAHLGFRERLLAVFGQLVHVLIHVFEDEEEFVAVFDDFMEIDDVRVV